MMTPRPMIGACKPACQVQEDLKEVGRHVLRLHLVPMLRQPYLRFFG